MISRRPKEKTTNSTSKVIPFLQQYHMYAKTVGIMDQKQQMVQKVDEGNI